METMTENIIGACVYTCNSIVFKRFSADSRTAIKTVVWTRIDRSLFDDNETHSCGNALGSLHNSAFSKGCVFDVNENASIDSRPHYRFDAFSNVRTKTFENDRMHVLT